MYSGEGSPAEVIGYTFIARQLFLQSVCSTSRKYAKFTNSYHCSCLYKGRTGTTLELVASCDENIVVYANMRAGDLYRTARTDHVAYPVGPKQFGRCRAAAGS